MPLGSVRRMATRAADGGKTLSSASIKRTAIRTSRIDSTAEDHMAPRRFATHERPSFSTGSSRHPHQQAVLRYASRLPLDTTPPSTAK